METEYQPIERIAAPSRRAFEQEFVRTRRPVILTGLIEDWPARGRWSIEYLERQWADHRVVSLATRDGVVEVAEDRDVVFSPLRLGDQLRTMRESNDSGRYVSVPLASMPESFQRELATPRYCEDARLLRARFWLGRRGTVTPLHRDVPHNLSAQVFGRKRWLLYPPSDDRRLYPCRPWSRAPNFARVDPEAPDFERFPRFASARPLGCVLEPGEVLFIPHLHWHHVRSLDDNAAVNYWYGDGAIAALGHASALFKRVRALCRGEWE